MREVETRAPRREGAADVDIDSLELFFFGKILGCSCSNASHFTAPRVPALPQHTHVASASNVV